MVLHYRNLALCINVGNGLTLQELGCCMNVDNGLTLQELGCCMNVDDSLNTTGTWLLHEC